MKKLVALVLLLLFTVSIVGCSEYSIQYTCDLSQFPSTEKHMGFGKVVELADKKMLVAPVLDADKAEYGELVWLVDDRERLFSVGQVVTYTFYDVKAPDRKGDPLNIIVDLVYME